VPFAPVFAEYHQFIVAAGADVGKYLDLFTVGDGLLSLTGASCVTVHTGPHTGEVAVDLVVLPSAPGDEVDGWDAAAEVTVFNAAGGVSVQGLMTPGPEALRGLDAGPPGLLRVRALARHRVWDTSPPDPRGPEQHRVLVWPVDEETGFRTLATDAMPAGSPDPPRAAASAMLRLVKSVNPDPRALRLQPFLEQAGQVVPPDAGRVVVRRGWAMSEAAARVFLRRPADHLGATTDGTDLVLPAGWVDIRLRPIDAGDRFAATWRWVDRTGTGGSSLDEADSSVSIDVLPAGDGTVELALVHSGVRAWDAVPVGLVWDYLLGRVATVQQAPHPWTPALDVAVARADARRRATAEREALTFGGTPPTERLRDLRANIRDLSTMDRRLVDAMAAATPQAQRALAAWAARRACEVAEIDTIDWIAAGLAALDQGGPLPAPFDDPLAMWPRLHADERIPRRTVRTPRSDNMSLPHLVLPTVAAAGRDDALAGAVDAVYWAVLAYGDRGPDLLREAAAMLSRA
jgi:hypothetical protein